MVAFGVLGEAGASGVAVDVAGAVVAFGGNFFLGGVSDLAAAPLGDRSRTTTSIRLLSAGGWYFTRAFRSASALVIGLTPAGRLGTAPAAAPNQKTRKTPLPLEPADLA